MKPLSRYPVSTTQQQGCTVGRSHFLVSERQGTTRSVWVLSELPNNENQEY
jgi:hypothetical protein